MKRILDFFTYYSESSKSIGVKIFSLEHFEWLLVTFGIMFLILLFYKRSTLENKKKWLKLSAAMLLFLYFFRLVWSLSIGKFSPDSMLPFHLCALMVGVQFVGVFYDNKLLREFAYCAGLPGALMAFLTPDINGLPLFSLQYQVFIYDHAFLILIPLMWILGGFYIPDKRYSRRVFGIMLCLALVDGVINKTLHSNYMFVSKAPLNTPFVYIQDNYGYRGYLAFLILSARIAIELMYLPWRIKSANRIKESCPEN
jgi:hypothetical integral membrane protein (TIGR02206 family)